MDDPFMFLFTLMGIFESYMFAGFCFFYIKTFWAIIAGIFWACVCITLVAYMIYWFIKHR